MTQLNDQSPWNYRAEKANLSSLLLTYGVVLGKTFNLSMPTWPLKYTACYVANRGAVRKCPQQPLEETVMDVLREIFAFLNMHRKSVCLVYTQLIFATHIYFFLSLLDSPSFWSFCSRINFWHSVPECQHSSGCLFVPSLTLQFSDINVEQLGRLGVLPSSMPHLLLLCCDEHHLHVNTWELPRLHCRLPFFHFMFVVV